MSELAEAVAALHAGRLVILPTETVYGLAADAANPAAVARISIWEAMRSVWPFYAAGLVVLLMVTYIPALSLWLPGVFR